jgi:hypothetical protein
MTRNLAILWSLLALIVIAAAALNLISYTRYVNENLEPPTVEPVEYATTELPKLVSLRSPRAILVLDVSGSMKDSDRGHLQTEAVQQFFSVYRNLAQEILHAGDHAYVSIILFSTIAQVIDWRGDGNLWLEANEANDQVFRAAIIEYLGREGSEPRTGQETDYLAALEEIHRLVDGAASPPAVLFMTDGTNEPHRYFTPTRLTDKGAHDPRVVAVAEQVARGDMRRLQPGRNQPIFDRRAKELPPAPLNPAELADAAREVEQSLTELLGRRFPLGEDTAVPLLWSPLFLRGGEPAQRSGDLHDLFSHFSSDGPWGGRSLALDCHNPQEIASHFITALSVWMQLQEQTIPAGALAVQAPKKTQAFAVVLRTASEGTHAGLVSGTNRVALTGSGMSWAGVAVGDGKWELSGDAGAVVGGKLFYRPRYEWVLFVPSRARLNPSQSSIEVRLYLYSVETGSPVDAPTVYADLPNSLPLRVQTDSSVQSTELRLGALQRPGDPPYRADVALQLNNGRRAMVEADLRPLKSLGIPLRAESLHESVEIRPGLRVDIIDSHGRPVAPHLKNIPRESEAVRKWWSSWRAHE